jgi:hypothetical protein
MIDSVTAEFTAAADYPEETARWSLQSIAPGRGFPDRPAGEAADTSMHRTDTSSSA